MSDFPSGVALVTGGSGGLGRAICLRLGQAGARVALTYRHNRAAGSHERCNSAAGRRGAAGGNACAAAPLRLTLKKMA